MSRYTRQQIQQARDWIGDCQWADEFEVDELTPAEVMAGVEAFYDGGWKQFVKDGQ